jgi:hypothetical protein
MAKHLFLALFAAGMLSAQSINLAGVWKADLQQSKIGGPPLKDYLEIIQQKDVHITETMGATGQHGEQRSQLLFTTDGKPLIKPYQGVPSRETAIADAAALTLTIETSGRPDIAHRKYELAGGGQTLTITVDGTANDHPLHNVYVLLKQPDSAGDPLRKSEQLASDRFKNVKTPLKDLPSSEFIDRMRYFAWALNKDCEFCHVKNHFDSDDKDEKRTARHMLEMVASIDKDYFKGKPEVNCYTCHEFRGHPQGRPRFEGEPEHHHGEGEPDEPEH